MASSLRALFIGGVGGAGGVALARLFSPSSLDITYEEQEGNKKEIISLASTTSSSATRILKYGAPTAGIPPLLEYENHVLEYDSSRKVPKWVAEHLTKERVFGTEAIRKGSNFRVDPVVPTQFSADNRDFSNSGWSRGHMAPAGNNTNSQEAMDHTFYLTNIVPQDISNKYNYWHRLEMYCRELTKTFSDVYIISGPLWLPQSEEPAELQGLVNVSNSTKREKSSSAETSSGDSNKKAKVRPKPMKKFVKYPVIGRNNVAVPTHLFKVVLVEDPSLVRPMLGAFIVPNSPIKDVSLSNFEVDLSRLETAAGVKFHAQLNREKVDRLCSVEGCRLQDYKEFVIYAWKRRFLAAWNINALEKDWLEAKKRGLPPPEVEAAYLSKREELLQKNRLPEDGGVALSPEEGGAGETAAKISPRMSSGAARAQG